MFLLPLIAGAGLFRLGVTFRRWPRAARGAAVAVCLAAIAASLLSATRLLPGAVEGAVFRTGGMTTVLCWVALFLLGVVWGVPHRTLTSPFLATLAVVALVVLAIEASGRLMWRFSPDAWDRTAGEDGLLRQSSGMTCSPSAAVMLLHRYGVTASEGEMAYLAGTSLLGTDARSVARALEAKVAPLGWKVEFGPGTYDECLRRGEPFLAHVSGPTLGHAVTVVGMTPDEVVYLDPADGKPGAMSRTRFEREWDGTVVRIVK